MIRKIVLKLVVFIFCFILTSCLGVYYVDLGHHYAWLEDCTIVKIKEETENTLYYDILIRPQVLNYNYDDKYVIAYQVYDGSEYYYDSCHQRKEELDSLLAQFEKLKKMKCCYWIVDKESGNVIGPLSMTDFNRRREQLRVKVKLRKIHERKFRVEKNGHGCYRRIEDD